MAGNEKYTENPNTEDPKTGEVWGFEGYGLQGHEDKYVFAVAFCIDGGPLRCLAFSTDGEITKEVRGKAVDKCLTGVENTWLSTVPDIFERDHVCHPGYWVGGSRYLAGPKVTP